MASRNLSKSFVITRARALHEVRAAYTLDLADGLHQGRGGSPADTEEAFKILPTPGLGPGAAGALAEWVEVAGPLDWSCRKNPQRLRFQPTWITGRAADNGSLFGSLYLRQCIASRIAQTRAALAVSRELVLLYWSIGAEIVVREKAQGWGAKVVDRIGLDLQQRFPGVESFNPRNLRYMRSTRSPGAHAGLWPARRAAPRGVAQRRGGDHKAQLRLGVV